MWNSQAPLQLLLSMPNTLNKENLINLQKVIDVDKIINSQRLKRDLCGEYAPFCDFCNKKLPYPCAQAYVKMKQSEGLDVEVEEQLSVEEEPAKEVTAETTPEVEPKEKKTVRIAYLKRKK